MKLPISLIILTLYSVCILAETKFVQKISGSSRILGGDDAEEGQFPHQVSLQSEGTHWCGGSIISDRFILCAAHCTQAQHSDPAYLQGIVGSVNRLNGGVHIRFSHIINHPSYDNDDIISLNDISLLRTVEKLIFTKFIQPIALPTQNSIGEGIVVIVSGWGVTSVCY